MGNERDEIIDYSLLGKAITQDFGIEIHDLQRIQIGYSNKVYKGTLDGKTVFVRMQKDSNLYPIEEAVYRELEAQDIPVPKILAIDLKPKNLGYATMIMESAKGTPLGDMQLSPDQTKLVYNDAGTVMKRMHNIKLPSFGKLSLSGGKLVGEIKSFPEYMTKGDPNDSNWMYAIKHKLITEEESQKVLEIWERISHMTVDQAVLSHNDFHGGHIFTDGEKVTGVIDFTDARGEDPRWDLCMAMFFQNDEERKAFEQGYGEIASDPVIKDYLIFVAVCKLGWRYKHGHTNDEDNSLEVFRKELKRKS